MAQYSCTFEFDLDDAENEDDADEQFASFEAELDDYLVDQGAGKVNIRRND